MADLEARLRDLFAGPVATAVADASTALTPLVGEEAAIVGPRWSTKRLWEYQAGRHCARLALTRLGADPATLAAGIVRGEQGAPTWPPGWAGSITHTGHGDTRWAACVVSRELISLGLDAEIDAPLEADLQRRILTERERRWAHSHCSSATELGHHALLVFSAKEAFYKCQFPVSRLFLGFHEVETEFDRAGAAFMAWSERPLGLLAPGQRLEGRFLRVGDLVVTSVTLPADIPRRSERSHG